MVIFHSLRLFNFNKLLIGQDYFDEVGCWLRKQGFYKYYELFKQKGIFLLKEISQKINRADLKKVN